ncbi:hypothetical protein V6N13_010595 [Hibiscus sabdariffa]|uniref:Uncharacterized protein n=2 Tax=Hibiscus sabdariffa TaxID=183260 RepID=A0ABR2AYK3_9ROSI
MCLVFVCDEDERVIARQPTPGACPYCGGIVQAMDFESQRRFCLLPLYFRTKRSSRKLARNGEVLYSSYSL